MYAVNTTQTEGGPHHGRLPDDGSAEDRLRREWPGGVPVEVVWNALRRKWEVFVLELHEMHVSATELRVRYLRLAEGSLMVFKHMAADEPEDLHEDLCDEFLVEVGHGKAEEIMDHVVHLLDPELGEMDGHDLIIAYHGADGADWVKPRELRLAPPRTVVTRHCRKVETFRYNRRFGRLTTS